MTWKHCLVLKLAILGLCLICHQAVVDAHVLVYRRTTTQLIEEFNDLPATFGPPIVGNNLRVFVVPHETNNAYGCNNLRPPPRTGYPIGAKFVAIVSRGGDCTFERKVRVAQNATYYAVIIYNNEGDELEQMTANNASGIHIASVFVGLTTGKTLLSFFTPEVVLIINDELPFNINTQLILPFSILIALCFLIMIVYMIYKCIREQRRLRRYRLPKSMLKKIPVLRYTKNNTTIKYETCVICLEDFVEDDKLRVLPCSHPYHSHCIDPWLTENRRVCPICKRKVFTKGEARASRNRQPSLDSVTDTDDDTTPLLQQQPQATTAAAEASGSNSASINSASSATGTTRHGTFRRGDAAHTPTAAQEYHSSDDENALLDSAMPQANTSASLQRRVNPFDRSPNLPAHLVDQLSPPRRSLWSRLNFSFLFRDEPRSISVAAPPYLDHLESGTSEVAIRGTVATVATAAMSTPTSNNILNPNLSGSFKDDDMPPHRSIYEPIAISTPATEQETPSGAAAVADSVFLQTPTQGGIGVAALPHSAADRQFLI
ncbi:E3 ubiquitin-protein ligase RNF13 [Drosophila novamexicana]|uniref:E3 ubiquitin-protein ligase RNF13 n=1 Tax=Drosophila novamexicana TaxID=47314 RepID=UPI0011E5F875|nr:E3 ubiquitin-protein ligase RNF13 [Drosophila novamexicana]XP_030563745.1 E3 ubiquitin-protein ligase RNF13 [Drosophila novamexicana]